MTSAKAWGAALSFSSSVLPSAALSAFVVAVAELARVVLRFSEFPIMLRAVFREFADGALSDGVLAGRAPAPAENGAGAMTAAVADAQFMPPERQSEGQCVKAAISICYEKSRCHFSVADSNIGNFMAVVDSLAYWTYRPPVPDFEEFMSLFLFGSPSALHRCRTLRTTYGQYLDFGRQRHARPHGISRPSCEQSGECRDRGI
jgi:hypothetical protein